MTIRKKYKQLRNQSFVRKMITDSVYATMKLEGQGISKNKLLQLYNIVIKEKAIEGGQSAH